MLSFVGALSLEAYLIHDHFVLQYIEEQGSELLAYIPYDYSHYFAISMVAPHKP